MIGVTSPELVTPHQPVEHGANVRLLCPGCYRDLKVFWAPQSIGLAECDCGWRFAYKHKYDKFVRV